MTVETPTPGTTPAVPSGTAPAASPAQPGGPATPPPAAPPPDKSTLSKQLFPDFYDKEGKLMDTPAKGATWHPGAKPAPSAKAPTPPAPTAPAPAAPPVPTPPAAPPPVPTSTPEYLDLAQTSGKKIKFKDGEREWEASLADVVKNHQLDAHLTQKAQRLADKEKEIKSLIDDLRMIPPDAPPTPPKPGEPPATPPAQPPAARKPDETDQAYIKRLEARLANVEEVTQEQRLNRNLQNLAGQIERETGHKDFMDFVPEIRQIVLAKVKDPRNPTPEELFYDTPAFYRQTFAELKLKKISGGAAPAPTPPAPSGEPAPAPVRKAPEIPAGIEPGGGAPSAPGVVDDWQQRYEAAHEKAVKSGTEEDWQEVIRLKFEKPAQ